jgi:tetratricopeptide (TPR) repeat protein
MDPSGRTRFDSWKEIASYLKTSVRTVQRWEKDERLPVHRHTHARQDTVYAYQDEIDAWRSDRDRQITRVSTSHSTEMTSLQAELASAASAAPDAACRSLQEPFLRREEELRILQENLEAVSAGDVRIVCLTGEPGAGKTTLLQHFIAGIQAGQGTLVTFSACSQRLAGTDAFLPLLDSLDGLTRTGENAVLTQLLRLTAPTWYVQIAPLWSTADPGFASVLERARAASPERLKRELSSFIAHITAVFPLVIAIDDLHWADASTVEVVAYLLSRPELRRLLVVCAYRQTEMALSAHPFVAIRHELIKRRVLLEVPLRQLNREATAEYLDLVFPHNGFPTELADAVQVRSNGNPLFVSEIARHLIQRSVVHQREGQWCMDGSIDQVRDALPASIQSVIQRKLDQLDAEDRLLMMSASLQGMEFDSRLAAMAAGSRISDAEQRLASLAAVQSLVTLLGDSNAGDAVPGQRYAFVHVLYQEALQAAVTPARKAEWSRVIAHGLAELNKDNPSRVAADLAIHYETGREFEPAAQWFLRAARNAATVFANHEAADLCRRAIDSADRLEPPLRNPLVLEAAMLQAELHLNVSEFENAVADFGLAEKAASGAGLVESRVDAICGAALALFNLKRTSETRALGLKALELGKLSTNETAVASAQIVLAMERMCMGDFDAAEALSTPALPMLQTRSRPPIPLHVIEGVGYGAALHGWRLEYQEALPPCEWALEKARERGSIFHIVCLLFIRGLGLGNFGRLSDAMADLREAMQLSEINHERYWLPRLPNTLAWLHGEMFDIEEALRLNLEGSVLAREMRFPEGDVNSQINLALNHLGLGEPDRARDHLSAAETLLADDEWFRWVYTIRFHAAFAEYWLLKGDPAKADRCAKASLELASTTRRRKHIAWARKLLGDVAVMEDRPREAVTSYHAGLSELQHHPCPSVQWKISAALAATHAKLHQSEETTRWRAETQRLLLELGASIREGRLQTRFRHSRVAREFGAT